MKRTFLLPLIAMFAASANAQNALDIPVSVEILEPEDLVSIELLREGRLSKIAKPQSGLCYYQHRGEGYAFRIYDAEAGVLADTPGGTPSGCAQYGDVVRPAITVTCLAGSTVSLDIPADRSMVNAIFGVDKVLFADSWTLGTARGDGIDYRFDLECPESETGEPQGHKLELGIFARISSVANPPDGEIEALIPVEVIY